MSDSEPTAPIQPPKPVSGVEVICVVLLPYLWGSLVYSALNSAKFFVWFYGDGTIAPRSLLEKRQSLWVGAIAGLLAFLSALLLLRLGIGIPLAQVGLTTRNLGRNLLAGLVFAVIFVPGTYGIHTLALMVLDAHGSKPQDHFFTQIGSTGLFPIEWALLLFSAVVAAPVWEEFVFRGLIQPWVMRNGRSRSLLVLALAGLLALVAVAQPHIPSRDPNADTIAYLRSVLEAFAKAWIPLARLRKNVFGIRSALGLGAARRRVPPPRPP